MMVALETMAPRLDEDFSAARRFMVLGQVTPNGVTDPLLIGALEAIPRELFVPPSQRHRAYADQSVPLTEGPLTEEPLAERRDMMAPMPFARLLQLALPQPGERALVLGAGTGYGAAVLALMGLKVLAIESDQALVEAGQRALKSSLTENRPDLVVGDPRLGAPAGAPFRLILIEGAVRAVSPVLTSQLSEGGRLVTIRQGNGDVGRALMLRRMGGSVSEIVGLDASASLLPAFLPEPGFVF